MPISPNMSYWNTVLKQFLSGSTDKKIWFCWLPGLSFLSHSPIVSTAWTTGVPALTHSRTSGPAPAKPQTSLWSGTQLPISLSSEKEYMPCHWNSAQRAAQIQKQISTNEGNNWNISKYCHNLSFNYKSKKYISNNSAKFTGSAATIKILFVGVINL